MQTNSNTAPYFPENLQNYAPWVARHGLFQPYGKCQCGCGNDTSLAKMTDNNYRGTKKGAPQRFIYGHSDRRPIEFLFWSQVDKRGPDECWEWQGVTVRRGYGKFKSNGKIYNAHRFSYELHIGSVPKDLLVCHKCDNPPCCNPKHLFLGTHQDNMDDMIAKGRKWSAPGESCNFAKLTELDIQRIRQLHQDGKTNKEIARLFNVSPSNISMIVHYKTWRHTP